MKKLTWWFFLTVLFLVNGVLMGRAVAGGQHPITVRWCPEDAVHVGWGDFNGTRWDHYRCIARDDL